MRRLGLVVVLLTVLLAGCGSDGGGGGAQDDKAADALLAAEDFPAGWSKAPDDGGDDKDDEEDGSQFCDHLDPDDEFEPDGGAEAQYQSKNGGQFAVHAVALYEEEARAKEVMTKLRQGLDECKTFTSEQDGETFTGTMTAVTPPTVGDEAIAAQISAQVNGMTVTADMVIARKARGVTTVMWMGMKPEAGVLEGLSRKAADKLGAVAA